MFQALLTLEFKLQKGILHPDTNFDTLKFRATEKREKLFVYEIENLAATFQVNFTEIIMSFSETSSYDKVCNT